MLSYLLFFFSLVTASPPEPPACLSESEESLYIMINEYRESRGLDPVPFSARLTRVAQAHVRDLEDHFDFDPNGDCNPHSWSENGSWSPCCYTSDHSQAACMWDKPREIAGYEGPGYEIAYYSTKGASAREGLDGWIRSPSHHPLIINTGLWEAVTWQAVGVGIYGKYAVVWFGEVRDETEMARCR